MKVLVVDDEDDIRRIAVLSLSAVGGMEVAEASGGPEGIRKAREEGNVPRSRDLGHFVAMGLAASRFCSSE